jgi:hypothetical protein
VYHLVAAGAGEQQPRRAREDTSHHQTVVRSNIQQASLLTLAVAMFAIATVTTRLAIVPILIAVVALFLLATSLTAALPLSRSLRGFRNRPLRISIWGRSVPEAERSSCQIDSVRVLGAGLHLFLKCPDQSRAHLKIAQPRAPRIGERTVEIGEAAYVQWNGKRLPRAPEAAAVTLTLSA